MSVVSEEPFPLPAVPPLAVEAQSWRWAILDHKTKPPRSLGRLEELAAHFGALRPEVARLSIRATVVVAAADHGVAEEGVSAYPQEVTGQMLRNFEAGGAAVNALARAAGAELVVVDVGTKTAPDDDLLSERVIAANPVRKLQIRSGSNNCATGPALDVGEVEQAVFSGLQLADELASRDVNVVALGEMGIANSTIAALLTAAFCSVLEPRERARLVGKGTGVDEAGLAKKVATVERAWALHQPDSRKPWQVAAQVGGLEIAFLAGLAIGAGSHRMAIVLDGFISTAAALLADALSPNVRQYFIASHRSQEPGHQVALRHLGLEPYLDLGLRLGEGSGAAAFLPLLNSAAAIFNDMATFEAAGVSEASA